MPSVSSLLPEDKARVKRSIPSTNKILTATSARVYYDRAGTWRYAGIQGALVLCVDKQRGGVWWKVVDLLGTRGIIWEHELPTTPSWPYNQDRGFFHSFPSEETNVAFVFADESEANEMFKKVQGRGKYNKTKGPKAAATASSASGKKKKKGGPIDKSLISGPAEGSFKHIAHMGYTAENGFASSGVDPSWQALLDSLGNKGISQKQILENEGFIRDFVGKQGGPPPVQPAKRAPPKAPTSKRKAPPPPPSRASVAPPTLAPAVATPSMSPAPPTRPTSHLPPPPPPPPSRHQPAYEYEEAPAAPSAPPPPPRLPAPPSRSGAPPPPPPPPPPSSSVPPVPSRALGSAPPEPAAPELPVVPPARANLLASIQGAGGIGVLKKSPAPAVGSGMATGVVVGAGAGAAAAPSVAAEVPASSGGGDLASALAMALSAKRENLGESDEESDEDDEWD